MLVQRNDGETAVLEMSPRAVTHGVTLVASTVIISIKDTMYSLVVFVVTYRTACIEVATGTNNDTL